MALGGAVRAGSIAGIVTIYLALVGLVERFDELNLIGTEVTFARLALIAAPLVVGLALARTRVVGGESSTPSVREATISGAIAGATAGVVVAIAVVFADAFGIERIGSVFQNADAGLLAFLTFDQPAAVAAVIHVVIAAAAGAAAGAYRRSPAAIRKPVGAAVATTLALGFLQRIVPISLDQLNVERDWLYSKRTGGLTWIGAIVVAAVAAALSVAKARGGGRLRDRLRAPSVLGDDDRSELFGRAIPWRALAFGVGFLLVLTVPYIVGSVVSEVLGTVMVFALLGLGLNIVVGYAGLLDLGYVFFFAVGAYATALLTGATLNTFTGSAEPVIGASLNFYLAIPIVVAIAAGAGLMIGAPVLRLRGDYLALVTLGLGEVVTVLIASPWLVPLVGGPNGMRNVPDAAIAGFGFRDPQHFFYLALAFLLLAVFISRRLISSRIGRAWTAMREDEQIADAMGVATTRYKLLAFAMGGAIGSLGGALFAVKIGSLTPASFQVIVSIQVLGLVILGGIGSLPGVIVGSLVLVGLPGLLREFEEYRFLAYGAALVAVMILRPQGLVPNVRRSRELQDEEQMQDAWARQKSEEEFEEPPVEPTGGELRA
ncbi:MAG TPA: leucine/isoleucine/valine transporter permease subunit [Actinomycetota bacterium]|nr:leucine/isoleucine/valine transporter permease subunit [Actinomycetota bacterium]